VKRLLVVGTALFAFSGASLIAIATAGATAPVVKSLSVKGIVEPNPPSFSVCQSAGNCIIIGSAVVAKHSVVYVINEVGGKEAKNSVKTMPKDYVPFTQFEDVGVVSLSCPTQLACLATGYYLTAKQHTNLFTLRMVNGTWGAVTAIPAFPNQLSGGGVAATAVCWSANDCLIGGQYENGLNFVSYAMTDINGTLSSSTTLSSPLFTNGQGDSELENLSCATTDPGWCEGVGTYTDSNNLRQIFAVTFMNGVVQGISQIPAPADYGTGTVIIISGLSCWSAGNCVVVGMYPNASSNLAEWHDVMTQGTWGTATGQSVPSGYFQPSQPQAYQPPSLACAHNGTCLVSDWSAPSPTSSKQVELLIAFAGNAWHAPVPVTTPANAGLSSFACGATACAVFGTSFSGSVQKVFEIAESSSGTLAKPVSLIAYPSNADKKNPQGYLSSASASGANHFAAYGTYTTSTKSLPALYEVDVA
jgi:hypothetical protein